MTEICNRSKEEKMTSKHYYTWLKHKYVEDEKSYVTVENLSNSFCKEFGDVSKNLIGRCLKVAFQNIKKSLHRDKSDWGKNVPIYKGLKEREGNIDKVCLSDIPRHLPDDIFIISKCNMSVTLAFDTSMKCNDNPIYLEANLDKYGNVNIVVGDRVVNDIFGLEILNLDVQGLSTLFSLMKKARYCHGVPIGKIHIQHKENIRLQQNENNKTVGFSLHCQKVLDFKSWKSTVACKRCQDACRPVEIPIHQETSETATIAVQSPVVVAKTDHTHTTEELIGFIRNHAPYLSEGQIHFFESQLHNAKKSDKHAHKWDNKFMQMALSIWTRSPRVYHHLQKTDDIVLPSESTLTRYKCSVSQGAGINDDMLHWMAMQAKHDNIPTEGYYGGVIMDEMAIQEDLQIIRKQGTQSLVGFTDTGKEGECLSSSPKGLANHVMQFMFHGLTGFRFLIAHYPTSQASGSQLYCMFWDVVQALEKWGFHAVYSCMDGSSNNRVFIKLHFKENPLDYHMAAVNQFCDLHPLVFLSDPSHLFKKIRNSILKSGKEKWHTRLLQYEGEDIAWRFFVQVYEWDKNHHGLMIHHKLTHEHIYPNNAEKMRNHLAEDVLDGEMLHLFRRYKESLVDRGHLLDGVIALLEQTSALIRIFRDRRPMYTTADERLRELEKILIWFTTWENNSHKNNFLSRESFEDLTFLLHGYKKLVQLVTQKIKHTVTPAFINSDIIENHFSQQRSLHHGSGTNPNFVQYCQATNNITLCQSLVPKKANAFQRKAASSQSAALPFKQLKTEFKSCNTIKKSGHFHSASSCDTEAQSAKVIPPQDP